MQCFLFHFRESRKDIGGIFTRFWRIRWLYRVEEEVIGLDSRLLHMNKILVCIYYGWQREKQARHFCPLEKGSGKYDTSHVGVLAKECFLA
jgi:hypothetical protein